MSRSGYHQTDVMPPKPKSLGSPILIVALVMLAGFGYLGLVVPKLMNGGAQAKQAAAKSDLRRIGDALDAYRLDVGIYPSSNQGLNALVTAPTKTPSWHGPYLRRASPTDPWGNPYVYNRTNPTNYYLLSYAADGIKGGRGYGEDIEELTVNAK